MAAVTASQVVQLAVEALDGQRSRPPNNDPETAPDWGVPLLARLADHPTVLVSWIAGYRGWAGRSHPALFARGSAGFLVGLEHAEVFEPRFAALTGPVVNRLVEWCAHGGVRTESVGWHDYDLILGTSGVVCALAARSNPRPEHLVPGVRHLIGLAADDGLTGLVVGTDDGNELRRWNVGRHNHGLGHGIPGVLAALIAAWPVLAGTPIGDELAAAVRRLGRYLLHAAYVDERRVWSWTPGSVDPGHRPAAAPRRQAWCYGTPGVAWQLCEAGRVLGDNGLLDFGRTAMESLCTAWDDDFYLDTATTSDRYAWCHGAAGVLAIADAFQLHLDSSSAGALATHLRQLLTDDLDDIATLTADLTMLNGAPGPLAVLLTHPDRRHWLPAVGLR